MIKADKRTQYVQEMYEPVLGWPQLSLQRGLKYHLQDNATSKEKSMLRLLEFGMSLDYKPGYGVKKTQRNHFSSLSFKVNAMELAKISGQESHT